MKKGRHIKQPRPDWENEPDAMMQLHKFMFFVIIVTVLCKIPGWIQRGGM